MLFGLCSLRLGRFSIRFSSASHCTCTRCDLAGMAVTLRPLCTCRVDRCCRNSTRGWLIFATVVYSPRRPRTPQPRFKSHRVILSECSGFTSHHSSSAMTGAAMRGTSKNGSFRYSTPSTTYLNSTASILTFWSSSTTNFPIASRQSSEGWFASGSKSRHFRVRINFSSPPAHSPQAQECKSLISDSTYCSPPSPPFSFPSHAGY